MDLTLDKDYNPIWLCKLAGVLFPSIGLLAAAVWVGINKAQSATDWVVLGWCSFLLLAFWLRYRSGKVASLGWEFTFGTFLTFGVALMVPVAHRDWNWWAQAAYVGFCFFPTAIKYVRHFYFPSNRNSEQPGIQGRRR
jgi:hypothetical protein